MKDEVEEGANCNCAVSESNDDGAEDGDGSLSLESQFLSLYATQAYYFLLERQRQSCLCCLKVCYSILVLLKTTT